MGEPQGADRSTDARRSQDRRTPPDHHRLRLSRAGGLRVALHAHPARRAKQHFPEPGGIQPDLHHARHDDDVSLRHSDGRSDRRLPRAADDRVARHPLSPAECFQLLDVPFRRHRHLCEFPVRPGARWRLVRVRTPYGQDLLAGVRPRLLEHRPDDRGASRRSRRPSTSSSPSSRRARRVCRSAACRSSSGRSWWRRS